MSAKRVLVVEDDAAIRQGVVDALRFHGFDVAEAADGTEGLSRALGPDYDLLLLDLVLPGRDGLEILREVRLAFPTLPVIVLTARGEEADRVSGLKLGADDYVVKPFGIRELLARVEAVLRRSPERPRPAAVFRFARQHGILHLMDQAGRAQRFQNRRRPSGLFRRIIGNPDIERLALMHGVRQRGHRLFERRVGIEPVGIENIDVIQPQAFQALIEARE